MVGPGLPRPGTVPAGDVPTRYVSRFGRTERLLHWTHASAFLVMLATGLVLMLPTLSEIVARRPLVKGIHLWTAVAWVVVVVLILLAGDRRALRDDWREIESFDRDDRGWLTGGRRPQGKFNAGQKLNALLTAAFAVLFLVSGFFLWLGERDHSFLFDGTGTVHVTLTWISLVRPDRAPLSRPGAPDDPARPSRDDAWRRSGGLGGRAPCEVARGATARRAGLVALTIYSSGR